MNALAQVPALEERTELRRDTEVPQFSNGNRVRLLSAGRIIPPIGIAIAAASVVAVHPSTPYVLLAVGIQAVFSVFLVKNWVLQ